MFKRLLAKATAFLVSLMTKLGSATSLKIVWRFRVVYSQDLDRWLIQIDESGMNDWQDMADRENTHRVSYTKYFPTYHEGLHYAYAIGLPHAYVLQRTTPDNYVPPIIPPMTQAPPPLVDEVINAQQHLGHSASVTPLPMRVQQLQSQVAGSNPVRR